VHCGHDDTELGSVAVSCSISDTWRCHALAASSSGLYAGPLWLLAHEIWERLNRGQIVPLGMDPEPGSEPDTTTNMDVANETGCRPTVRKEGHAK
jgi:ATP-dependent RNA helicase SUPV3L1/SUV3